MTELDTTPPPDDQAPAEPPSTETAPTQPPVVPPAEAPDVEPVPSLEPAPEPAPLGVEPPATEEVAPEATPESPDVEAVPEPESPDQPLPSGDGEAGDVAPAPEPDLEPAAAEGPRTVGRYIADVLRAAGVRYAFTVPGESFLGLLDAFEGAGIRVIATRHEGAAAFMAEAHGQLTGRPAVALVDHAARHGFGLRRFWRRVSFGGGPRIGDAY